VVRWIDPTPSFALCQLPFREDERAFLFPSLTNLTSKSGQPIEHHKLLPTDDQLIMMDELVEEMDLDVFAVEDEETGCVFPLARRRQGAGTLIDPVRTTRQ
jgi:hypothetical protein